jgi:hypothetical protein
MTIPRLVAALALSLLLWPAHAQDKGSLEPRALPPLAKPDDPATPAKDLFGRKREPSRETPKVVGFYAKGCLAGGEMLPTDGEAWQVMRLSRNRNWGHPALTGFLKKTASELRAAEIWPGFLVGDMAQPRGGPMITGHASHQIGLDADVWLTPMPDRQLSRTEREEMSATRMVRPDRLDIDPARWTPAHLAMLKWGTSPKCSAFSSIRRSRRPSAGMRGATGPGCRRCGPCMGTTTTSTSAFPARWAKRAAPVRTPCPKGRVVTPVWPGGSRTRFCTPRPIPTPGQNRP